MEIIKRVLDSLDSKGHKMSDLCAHIGVSTSTVANWKTRGTDPPAKLIAPICEFLGVSYSFVLTGKEEATPDDIEQLSDEQKKILNYYGRLEEENQDYIKGEMVRLYKQQEFSEGGASKELSSTLDDTRKHA